jgi:hypothetical protein
MPPDPNPLQRFLQFVRDQRPEDPTVRAQDRPTVRPPAPEGPPPTPTIGPQERNVLAELIPPSLREILTPGGRNAQEGPRAAVRDLAGAVGNLMGANEPGGPLGAVGPAAVTRAARIPAGPGLRGGPAGTVPGDTFARMAPTEGVQQVGQRITKMGKSVPQRGLHQFTTPAGPIEVQVARSPRDPETLWVGWVGPARGGIGRTAQEFPLALDPGTLGAGNVRKIMREVRAAYPDVTRMSFQRVELPGGQGTAFPRDVSKAIPETLGLAGLGLFGAAAAREDDQP